MPIETEALTEDLVERVLARLGLDRRPEPTLEGLGAVYAAWCRKVPFDNILKLIHLRSGDPGPLPGISAQAFFEDWLRYGAGGTCVATTGALQALLRALGFDARLATARMLISPNSGVNHGFAYVVLEGARFALDATMLHLEPLKLDEAEPCEVAHGAWGVRCRPDDGQWIIRFRPMLKPEGLDCRTDSLTVSRERFVSLYEGSRVWNPFNFELSARLLRGDSVVGAAFGRRIEFTAEGNVLRTPIRGPDRLRFLVEDLGVSEELAARLPPDRMTPPPPRGFAG